MEKFLRLYDQVRLTPLAVDPTKQRFFETKDNVSPTGHSLVVVIAATHSGRVTHNNALYLPNKMSVAVPSFTSPYPKPVLKNHNEEGEPLGRVMSARYVDTCGNTLEAVKDYVTAPSITDFFKVIDFLGQKLKDPAFPGLGYIEVTAKITDADAIQKILDGRYLTVSTSMNTNQAICSICKQDWLSEGKCDHDPGTVVDDKLAYIICGDMTYNELSYVNRPADPLALNMEIHHNYTDGDQTEKIQVQDRGIIHEVFADAYVQGPELLVSVRDPKNTNLYTLKDNLTEVLNLMSQKDQQGQADPKVIEFIDKAYKDSAFEIDSHHEREFLVSVHNHLHHKHDWDVDKDGKHEQVPHDAIRLHGKLHDFAGNEGLLGSLIVGRLDNTLHTGAPLPPQAVNSATADPSLTKGPTAVNADTQTSGKTTFADADDDPDDKKGKGKKKKKEDEDPEDKGESPEESKGKKKEKNEKNEKSEKTEKKDQVDSTGLLTITDFETLLADSDTCYDAIAAILDELQLSDKKLSTESREKMKSSTFCDPKNRAFPVPDCAHVTAARRLLSRYQGGTSKDKISACIERKAKSLGCDSTKKDGDNPGTQEHKDAATEFTPIDFSKIPAEQLDKEIFRSAIVAEMNAVSLYEQMAATTQNDSIKTILLDIAKEEKTHIGEFQFMLVQLDEQQAQELENGAQEAAAKIVIKRQDKVCESCQCLQAQVDNLTQGTEMDDTMLDALEMDLAAANQEIVDLHQQLHGLMIDYMVDLKTLQDPTLLDADKHQALKNDLAGRQLVSLQDSLKDIRQAVDITKTTMKVNDGMARDPEGGVGDPTLAAPETEQQDAINTRSEGMKKWIMDTFMTIHAKDRVAAQRFLDSAKVNYKEQFNQALPNDPAFQK